MSGPRRLLMTGGGGAPSGELSTAIIDAGPWAYWKGDESSGVVFADSSGNSRDADLFSGSLQGWTGPDGVMYPTGVLEYVTTALRLSATDATVISFMWMQNSDNAVSVLSYNQTAGVGSNPAQSTTAWRAVGDSNFRVETVRTTGTTWRGRWAFGAGEVVANAQAGGTVHKGTTYPVRFINGVDVAGSAITGSGSQRETGAALTMGDKWAHLAIWLRAVTASEMAVIYTAAQADGW